MGGYAVLYAIAKLNGWKAYVHPTMHFRLSPYFKITMPILEDAVASIPWRIYQLEDCLLDRYTDIDYPYVVLQGYPNSWTFYHYVRSEILQEFTFHRHLKDSAWRTLDVLRGERANPTYVGVHVRRTDYVQIIEEDFNGVVADQEYFKKAMAYFRLRYSGPLFVVVSDDMDWCRENIDTSHGDVYFAGEGLYSSPGRDLALLAHCNHTIMTYGTFGYWAGYLAGGEVVYVDIFTLPHSPLLERSRRYARYLPGWVGIGANVSSLRSRHQR
ncbi:galactoside alpha-(1,2)-fucosyltransferase 2-like [Ornithodoros turicata]|uniref:galactoside alpha-(1,2)-fucosyltransferase 2-like n=1 Tax=Ornithodoros turicata TaxID=34597 RepID=UPI00313A2151